MNRLSRARRWLLPIGVFVILAGFLSALVLVSGVVPIKASSGHWPITEWFLQFAKRRSVATHTIGLEVPPLDTRGQVLKGAGQYESACRPCHGSPELRDPGIPQAMLPKPPYLPARVGLWEAAELFSIVKHGIKFTGMPAWPAQTRDDEVWAMVSFLRAFPQLSPEAYRRLVYGEGPAPPERPAMAALEPQLAPPPIIELCGRCHGLDGQGRGAGAFPRLAGQQAVYMDNAMRAFAQRERHSGIMGPIAAALSEETRRDLAQYYSALPAQTSSPSTSAAVAAGAAVAARGIPEQRVPPCQECHGPASEPRNPAYPRLAGQYAEYLMLQLELFAEDRRGGSPYAHIMRDVADRLTPDQRRDVARYFASLLAVP